MNLMPAFCLAAAVLHLVSGQAVRPIFNDDSYMGTEGGNITGHLVLSGLSEEDFIRSGELLYEIYALQNDGLAKYDNDYSFQNETGRNSTVVVFSPNRDASSSFIINLHQDNLHEGEENFFLGFRFLDATGDFRGAAMYEDSSASQESQCIINDIESNGILVMCFDY
jgi:hypothetical protein